MANLENGKARDVTGGGIGIWLLLLLLIYAAGLTQSLSEPWIGMHDWNGAFFSQLARNHLRYPMSVHRGMPMVAVGSEVPDVEERSIYATHPPGLVWLVAGAFAVFGEAESVARMVPIAASLATLGLLVWLVFCAYGRAVAVLTGFIYGLMPMSVYFGRMVDHEAVCLLCMIALLAAWVVVLDVRTSKRTQRAAWCGWAVAVIFGVWIDWSMVLFAGLFCAYAVWAYCRSQIGKFHLIVVLGTAALAVVSMIAFLVYAGLEGRWEDLVSIFLSRAGQSEEGTIHKDTAAPGGVGTYTVENLSWPVTVLTVVGFLVFSWAGLFRRGASGLSNPTTSHPGQTAKAGLALVLLTGLIWLVVFWRQYERHNYWLFYLGPVAAVYSARFLVGLWSWLSTRNRYLAFMSAGSIVVVTVAFCLDGARDYFDRVSRSYPPELVSDWQAIRGMTSADDRVLLFRNPVLVEERGGYRFRNLIPPQLAYYLDRPIDVEEDFARLGSRRASHAVFVISKGEVVVHREALGPLRQGLAEKPLRLLVVFDLR
ncbi:MAG: glycosyltransferase family 39 protein [Phycisphaerales bacterium]|nr:glycosyltransferase family 39 protein [Phycisphaerales bacterium]